MWNNPQAQDRRRTRSITEAHYLKLEDVATYLSISVPQVYARFAPASSSPSRWGAEGLPLTVCSPIRHTPSYVQIEKAGTSELNAV